MVLRIVRMFHPDRVILFGSHARGQAGPDSDVDLLVVMPVEGSRRDKRIAIGASLADFGVPLDIVLSTPQELEGRWRIPGTIERPAMLEGKVLYERP
jgi:predicted nucleotidyltransferase